MEARAEKKRATQMKKHGRMEWFYFDKNQEQNDAATRTY